MRSFSNAASSETGFPNAAAELSMNFFFHRLIITGDSSNLAAISFNVSRPLMASSATCALNCASYFLLAFFMMLT